MIAIVYIVGFFVVIWAVACLFAAAIHYPLVWLVHAVRRGWGLLPEWFTR